MSDTDMTPPTNPFEGFPRHHLMFLNLRDGGGTPASDFYGVTVDELKAEFVRAGDELLAERGELMVYEQPVYDWAKR
ncbi:hypothetical protein [Pseudomonas syringae group sp. J309-1]|uniref:hypothetical protein n=1 Tax=Pseudomonas syringae group sp. J309-1 TaxID=3079588 RepID=UPI00290EDC21|nr:hypothetical protein [Pseudomonas syringae group sp. J309-1]MDU8358475.1 hypothetical protein [Pseudomonas syringae group sp. J309-1]